MYIFFRIRDNWADSLFFSNLRCLFTVFSSSTPGVVGVDGCNGVDGGDGDGDDDGDNDGECEGEGTGEAVGERTLIVLDISWEGEGEDRDSDDENVLETVIGWICWVGMTDTTDLDIGGNLEGRETLVDGREGGRETGVIMWLLVIGAFTIGKVVIGLLITLPVILLPLALLWILLLTTDSFLTCTGEWDICVVGILLLLLF